MPEAGKQILLAVALQLAADTRQQQVEDIQPVREDIPPEDIQQPELVVRDSWGYKAGHRELAEALVADTTWLEQSILRTEFSFLHVCA